MNILKEGPMKLAHRKLNENGSFVSQSIQDRCRNVASIAEGFAEAFDAKSIALYTGMLHDIRHITRMTAHLF